MKLLKTIKYVFLIAGIGMLIGTLITFKSTYEFLKISVASQGTIVKLIASRSTSSSGNSTVYRPVVQFIDQNGNQVEFVSSTGSNPPSYKIGEEVEVLYNPESPNEAKIKGFFTLWGGITVLGILGIAFSSVGGLIIFFDKRKKNLQIYLRQNGTKIESDFQRVIINKSLRVKGRYPYQIISQWQNPDTSKLHVFTSENILFNPANYIKTEKIAVLIDRRNPKKYLVDISFLPELSD